MAIGGYSINGYRRFLTIILMAIGEYFVIIYWWLLMNIILMAIGGYFINGYWWLFYQWLLVVIL
jgi:hypothetical protein